MEQWYGLTQEEVLKRLGTNRTGLSEEEAEKRLEVYGENILKEQEEMPWWQIFLGQFKDLLVMLLIALPGYPWSQEIRKVRWLSFPSFF